MIQSTNPVILYELPLNVTIQKILKDQTTLILWITSNPSLTLILKQERPSLNILKITGANYHEFEMTLSAIQNQQVDILVLGIEQLLNKPKLDTILQSMTITPHIVVDHIHHWSPISFDYRPEYENLTLLAQKFKDASWTLISHCLSSYDVEIITSKITLSDVIKEKNNLKLQNHIKVDSWHQLCQLIYNKTTSQSHLIITHDYLEAQWIAFLLNKLTPCGVVHRKVEETKKVDTLQAWQKKQISSLVITSDTILPYPYPKIDLVIWVDYPISKYQWLDSMHTYQTSTLAIITNHQPSFNQSAMHQFPYDGRLNEITRVLKEQKHGLTMREIERYYNIESYTLEKAMKGLRVFKGVNKQNMKYFPLDHWHFPLNIIKSIHKNKIKLFHQLLESINPPDNYLSENHLEIEDTITHSAMPIRPKILFPTNFYEKSLIASHHQTDYGYLFATYPYKTRTRVYDIHRLINQFKKEDETLSIVPFIDGEIELLEVINQLSNRLNFPINQVFHSFDSSSLNKMQNPFYKMTMIKNQTKLIHTQYLSDCVVVIANHGDHFWQMGVVGYELLSNNMCKRVIMIFNQF